MTRAFMAFGLIVGFSAVFCIALHFGQRWVDRMLHHGIEEGKS